MYIYKIYTEEPLHFDYPLPTAMSSCIEKNTWLILKHIKCPCTVFPQIVFHNIMGKPADLSDFDKHKFVMVPGNMDFRNGIFGGMLICSHHEYLLKVVCG